MKCEKPKKGERKKWVFKHNLTECIRGLKITTICFSMVDLLSKVLIPTQNLSYIFHNYIIINWIDL